MIDLGMITGKTIYENIHKAIMDEIHGKITLNDLSRELNRVYAEL